MMSLQQQLRRQWLISLVLLMLPLMLLTDAGVRSLTSHYVLSRLQHDADSLLAALTRDEQGQWQVDDSRLGTLYQRVYSGHYFSVSGAAVSLRSRSLWDQSAPEQQLSPGEQRHWQQAGLQNEKWLSLAQGVSVDGTHLTLWLAEDIGPLSQQLNRYRLAALLLLAALLVLLLVIQRRLLRAVFARLQPLQQQLQALRLGKLDSLSSGQQAYPQEVQPLAEEVDRLLSLLQERVSRSRNALGNLAHEMKRPLQQLQLLSDQLSPQQQQQQSDALQQLQTLIQRELKRARIVGMSSPGRQLTVADDLPPLLQVLHKLYPQTRIEAHYDDNAVLPQDRDDLLELLGNLLDNACQYGGGEVNVSLQQTDNAWQITVCDNGPGIAQAEQERLLQRGTRLDESGPAGSGLGLAIVSDIVASYQGTLTLQANEPTGLCVTIRLPLNSPA